MRSPIAHGARRLARAAQRMVSQIVVSVTAAVCVAFITGAYLGNDAGHAPGEAEQRVADAPVLASEGAARPAAANPVPALPPLDIEIIADTPIRATGREVFPGVPAGMTAEALRRNVADADAAGPREPRRFFGIPLPFVSARGA